MKTKKSRRDFLKISAVGGLGAIAMTQLGCKNSSAPATTTATAAAIPAADPKSFNLALQLYTIRDAMEKDVVLALTQVAKAGYTKIELANYAGGKFYGFTPAEFKKIVSDLGLNPFSSHTQVEAQGITLENAKKMAEDHAALGVEYCVQPWVVEEARTTIASYKKMVADWNKVGKIMKEHGMQFAYHNHNFEFDTIEGKVPYFDVYMPELDPDLVKMEIDLYWTIKAGHNPVDIFKKYPGRFPLFHMKDAYTKEAPFFVPKSVDFAPVGAGITDFKSILAARDIAGNKHLIVEQDCSFTDIRTSIDNLASKILG
jgi:sugar phosphate isomerase/epimerase